MIEIKVININSSEDYNALLQNISSLYIDAKVVDEIKSRLAVKCKRILIEYPYRDMDFSSTYSAFHTKKHRMVPKECYRIHFFADRSLVQDNYLGYLVLRPSRVEKRGSAYITPAALIDGDKYLLKTSFKAHILGSEFISSSFPWMSQETDIAVCAHAAVWSLLRYFSQKFHRYNQYTMDDIVQMTPQYIQRKTPSEGLNILQIAETFSRAGSHPLLLQKGNDPSNFIRNVFSYIESGIPIIGCMTRKEHAVAIIGHGTLDYTVLDSFGANYISSHNLIDSLVICDDNHLPYTEISQRHGSASYTFNDLDYVIVPLYEKMFLSADIVNKRVNALLKTNNLDLIPPLVLRTYMTSSKSLKEEFLNDESIDKKLVDIVLKTPMPRFVWCVDVSTKEEFKSSLMSGKIIIDITAGTYEQEPWILFHDSNNIKYYDPQSDTIKVIENCTIKPYSIYRNNLKEVKDDT